MMRHADLGTRAALVRRVWRWLAPCLAVALLVVVGWQAIAAIPPQDYRAAVRYWTPFGAAALVYLAMLALLPLLWMRMLGLLTGAATAAIATAELYAAYSRSWLARYIPGRVWTYGGRALLASRLGVPLEPVARSMALEILFSYGMLTALGIGLLAGTRIGPIAGLVLLALAVGGLAIVILFMHHGLARLERSRPQASPTRRWVARTRRLVVGERALDGRATGWGILAYGLHGCLNLVFMVLVAASFVDLGLADMLFIAGAWGLAMTLGWLAFLAPGGLGARDGVALVLLSQIIDAPSAALAVAAARVVSILGDLVFVVAVELVLAARRYGLAGRTSAASLGQGP